MHANYYSELICLDSLPPYEDTDKENICFSLDNDKFCLWGTINNKNLKIIDSTSSYLVLNEYDLNIPEMKCINVDSGIWKLYHIKTKKSEDKSEDEVNGGDVLFQQIGNNIKVIFKHNYLMKNTDLLVFKIDGYLTHKKLKIDKFYESISKLDDNIAYPGSNIRPPDPVNAAGWCDIVNVTNSIVSINHKTTGNPIETFKMGLNDFFSSVIKADDTLFDPWIVYDQYINRFVIIVIQLTEVVDQGIKCFMYLAISKDCHFSTSPSVSDWWLYVFDRTALFEDLGVTFPDYPKLGYDKDFYYISGNNFALDILGGFAFVSIFAIEKKSISSGGKANIVFDERLPNTFFSVHPVQMYECDPKVMFFASSPLELSSSSITIIGLNSGTFNGKIYEINVNEHAIADTVPQVTPTIANNLDNANSRIMSGVTRNNKLWTAHAIIDPNEGSGRTLARWYQFDIDVEDVNSTPTLAQQQTISQTPLDTDNLWMTHIAVDKYNNMGIAFSIGGTERHAGIAFTGRRENDPKNTTRPLAIARASQQNYQLDNDNPNRWGDYSGLAIDPNGKTFWLYNEYILTIPDQELSDVWKTFGASFTLAHHRRCCKKQHSILDDNNTFKEKIDVYDKKYKIEVNRKKSNMVSTNSPQIKFIDHVVADDKICSSLNKFYESISKLDDNIAYPDINVRPPDPVNAAGWCDIVNVTNSIVSINHKTQGNPIETFKMSLNDFFSSVLKTDTILFDPWIVYDQYINRFVIIVIQLEEKVINQEIKCFMYLAISKDCHFSTSPSTSDWWLYVFDRTALFEDLGVTFPDYPKLGYDKDFYYISGNNFITEFQIFYAFVSIFTIEKKSICSGGIPNIVFDERLPNTFFSVHTVQMYECDPKVMFFASSPLAESSNSITILSLNSGTFDGEIYEINVNEYNPPNQVSQLTPTAAKNLDEIDNRIMSGVTRNNKLWTANAIVDPNEGSGRTLVRWYQFDIDVKNVNAIPSLVQQQTISQTPLDTDNIWMSHIAVDKYDNMGIAFSIGGTERYAGIAFTGRRANDPTNTTRPLTIARASHQNYQIENDDPNRWGDYSGLAIDPNGKTFWLYNEYILTIPDQELSDVWKTFGASFTLANHRCCRKCCNKQNNNLKSILNDNVTFQEKINVYDKKYKEISSKINPTLKPTHIDYLKSILADNVTFQEKIDVYDKKYKELSSKIIPTLRPSRIDF